MSVGDPSLEPHHGLLDVDVDGTVQFQQLMGRVPARIAGEPVRGATVVPDGAAVVVGASRLRVGRSVGPPAAAAAVTVSSSDPWRRSLHRTPRAQPRWEPAPVPRPARRPAKRYSNGVGVTAAICTLIGSVVVATVMRSPLFLLLGAVGVLASLGMWVAGRIAAARDGHREGARRDRQLAAFAAAVLEQRVARWQYHLATTPTVAQAVAAATSTRADMWARRAADGDAYRVTLGWGPVVWNVSIAEDEAGDGGRLDPDLLPVLGAAERFDDAPVPTELGDGAALAVSGPEAAGVVRSIVVQLATWSGPADWRLVVVADDPAGWDWCRWLPHAPAVLPADDPEQQASARWPVSATAWIATSSSSPTAPTCWRNAPARCAGSSAAAPSVAVAVAVPTGEAVPAMCRSVLEIGSIGLARWCRRHVGARTAGSRARGRHRHRRRHTRRPARSPRCTTRRILSAAAMHWPRSVTLGALCERHGGGPVDDAIAIAAAWRSGRS